MSQEIRSLLLHRKEDDSFDETFRLWRERLESQLDRRAGTGINTVTLSKDDFKSVKNIGFKKWQSRIAGRLIDGELRYHCFFIPIDRPESVIDLGEHESNEYELWMSVGSGVSGAVQIALRELEIKVYLWDPNKDVTDQPMIGNNLFEVVEMQPVPEGDKYFNPYYLVARGNMSE